MDLINFIGENRKVKSIERKDGSIVKLPDFVNQARNRYFFDLQQDTMYKQCLDCKQLFKVAQLDENNEWVKYDGEIHAIRSGFRERCNNCLKLYKNRNESSGIGILPSDKAPRKEIFKSEPKVKKSILINVDLHHRLKVKAAHERIDLGVLVAEILETGLKT